MFSIRYTLLSVLLLCTAILMAQKNYYWSENQKIILYEDHATLSIQFHEKQNKALLLEQLKTVKQVKQAAYHPNAMRLIVDFHTDVPLDKVLATLRLNPNAVKSWSYGYELSDGFHVWLTHQIAFQPQKGVKIEQIQSFIAQLGSKSIITANEYDYYIIAIPEIEKVMFIANQIQESKLTTWCHPDFYAKITKYDDPLYSEQFQLNNTGQVIDRRRGVNDVDCNAPEAWTITKGDPSIIVAVVDDGVETHEDMVTAGGASRILSGYTPVGNGKGLPLADGAHGQSCAGIIAASHNEIGIRGIAPEVAVLPINIFTEEETVSQVANAFNYARTNGAAVISNSWGYSTCEGSFGVLNAAISNAATKGREGKGCIITFASGNSYSDCVEYPANLSSVIAVGAVTNTGVRSEYSNYGTDLDLVAPSNGEAGVRTIDRMGNIGYSAGNYTSTFGGTSAACPVVSGVVALVVSAKPNLTAAEITNILYATASDMGTAGKDNEYGHGRVNAFAALKVALGENVAVGGYCLAQGKVADDEWIKEVAFGNFVNTSATSLYTDFTNKIIRVTPSETYPLTVTPGYSGQGFPDFINVWIDYNQNESFEATELVFSKGPVSSATTVNVKIPSGLSGKTRMRVALKYEAAPSACESFEFGEVEDYTVEFTNTTTVCEIPTGLGVTLLNNTDVALTWAALEGVDNFQVRIRVNNGDWVVFDDINTTNIELTGFVVGASYEFQVRSSCGNLIYSAYSASYKFTFTDNSATTTYCNAVGNISQLQWIDFVEINEIKHSTGDNKGYADFTNLTANLLAGSRDTIFFSKGGGGLYEFYWTIYIDFNKNGTFETDERIVRGVEKSSNILFAPIVIPITAKAGKTRMRVLMKYNDALDPCGSFGYGEVEDYSINIKAATPNLNLADSPLNTTTARVYPNPTTDVVYIESLELGATISLYDNFGRLLQQFQATESVEQIALQHLSSGLYQVVVQHAQSQIYFSVVKE